MTDAALAIDSDERKRLGQYFTGEPLARVLAALGDARSASSLLDPMAGSGDMLIASRSVGAGSVHVTAVELDPLASSMCVERLRSCHAVADVRTADAFAPETWASDTGRSWDLVITNPPYVRYQRTSRGTAGRVAIPSASEVRRGLLQIVDARETLAANERKVFRTLVDGYSGLADLAVPSWLLCAALVAPEGRLAMVVPDTWLSRDYALPVLYLLRRFFDVEFVVEDGEAAWFEDALVRTTLVVARRVPSRPTALTGETACHVRARLTSEAASGASVVGALHPRTKEPERRFAERLREVARSASPIRAAGLDAQMADDAEFRDRLAAQVGATSWGRTLEPNLPAKGAGQQSVSDLPRQLRDLAGDIGSRLTTLDRLGWRAGQGLRTGANRFFYGEIVGLSGDCTEIRVDRELSSEPIIVPSDLLRVVVRKQSDLLAAGGDPERSPGRLILLDQHALEEDIAAAEAAGVHAPYSAIPEALAEVVRRAARLNVGSPDAPRLVPELSAVVTNVRRADPDLVERPPRFWYQLPPLAARHVGVLFMPRINHGHPIPVFNHVGVVVDANFSTFWPQRTSLPASALHALLSSTWSRAGLEAAGTVLGGGALKIEATQLRRLPLPSLGAAAIDELARLSAALSDPQGGDAALAAVDAVVWEALDLDPSQQNAIEKLCADLLAARHPRRRVA
jgi:predicted RNA methylase